MAFTLGTALLDINWLELLIQIISLASIVSGAIWALAVTLGNTRWAPKKEIKECLEKIEQEMAENTLVMREHISDQSIHSLGEKFVTRIEWNHERDMTAAAIAELKDLAKEQRDLAIKILTALNNHK